MIIVLMGGVLSLIVWAKPVGITLGPSKIKLEIERGTTGNSSIRVSSPNDFPINVHIGIEDFVPSSLPGDIDFVPKSEGVISLVDWIEINQEPFDLEPRGAREVLLKITVPENASPGGHYAAVFFTPSPKGEEEKSGGLASTIRAGALVYVTVSGETIQTGKIVSFESPGFICKGPVKFTALFKNTGTSHYEPRGTIKIDGLFKKDLVTFDVPGQVVLPQGTRLIDAIWNTKYLFGKYTATISLTDGEGEIHTAVVSFWAFPWKETALLVGGVAILMLLFKFIASKIKFQIVRKEKH